MIELILEIISKLLDLFKKNAPEPEDIEELEEELDKFHKLPKENEDDKTIYWKEK